MSLSPSEAAEVLGEISRTTRRSTEALCYANASPSFILWGVIWVVGYTGSDVLARQGQYEAINWLWFALVLAGMTGSTIIGRRQHRAQQPGQVREGRAIGMRWLGTLAALWLFVAATFAVLRPLNPAASAAFIPLLVALCYALFGIWRGSRFLYAGLALALLTLGGYFYLRELFLLWMAVFGGGSLVMVGLWLRKV